MTDEQIKHLEKIIGNEGVCEVNFCHKCPIKANSKHAGCYPETALKLAKELLNSSCVSIWED